MTKKVISVLLCLLMFAVSVPAVFAAGAQYRVTATKANLLSEPDPELTPLAELPRGTVLTAEKTSGNFIYVTLKSNSVSGWVHLGALTPIAAGKENPEKIKSIYVKTLPAKTAYTEGEESFTSDGLEIYAKYDGKADAKVSGYQLYVPNFNTYGTKSVDVVYAAEGGAMFYTSFTVTVNKVPVKSVTLVSKPDKTEYIENQKLNLTGAQIRVAYSDGRADEVYKGREITDNPSFTLSVDKDKDYSTPLRVGSHNITIIYKYPEFSVSFTVNAVKRKLQSLSLRTPPDSLITYSKKETPDLTGLTLEARYDNGEKETIFPEQCTVLCDPASFILGSSNKVTLQYEGKEVVLDFTYALDEAQGLKILTPTLLTFTLGEKIDLDELKVYTKYLSGKEIEVTDFTLSKIDPRQTGAQTVTVTYGSFSDVFTIYITPFYQKGDIDYDGKVTSADARLALRTAVGLINLSGKPFDAADADSDGKVTAADARLILRAAVELESLLHFDD